MEVEAGASAVLVSAELASVYELADGVGAAGEVGGCAVEVAPRCAGVVEAGEDEFGGALGDEVEHGVGDRQARAHRRRTFRHPARQRMPPPFRHSTADPFGHFFPHSRQREVCCEVIGFQSSGRVTRPPPVSGGTRRCGPTTSPRP